MLIIKPSWLAHGGERKDFEVYSCHVSPDGVRLATAAGDGHVRIWSIDAIFNAGDLTYPKPKQLASLSHHSGTIHTVRFAPNNRYLASGADDKIVCVYALEPTPPPNTSTFGTNESAPSEHWRVYRRLIGHDNDVQDLAWSPDSSILVSVGLDSKVVIWSGYTFEKLKTLSNHQSHVKGITFDPANKYFATASDDRTMKIVRYTPPNPTSSAHEQANNFVVEATITEPFTSSPLTTYFRRCSWSPDASLIAGANAVNGPLSSVAVIYRGSWGSDINLIGHEGPVEVAAFSPRLYNLRTPEQSKRGSDRPMVTLCACGSQDKSLSIWATVYTRPLLVAFDVCVKPISDLAWHPSGKSIFATSLDGTIIAVVFEPDEIGEVYGLEENDHVISKYGTSRRGAGLVEGAAGLTLEEKSKAGEMDEVEGRMGELMGETVANGRDRPTPTPEGASVALMNGTTGKTPNNAIVIQDEQIRSNGQHPNDQKAEPDSVQQADQNAAKIERLKQRVTFTKDGKKRIAPLLVSGSPGGAPPSLPKPQTVAPSSKNEAMKEVVKPMLDLSAPYSGLPQGGLASLLVGNKRKLVVPEGRDEGYTEKRISDAARNGAIPILTNGVDGLAPPTASSLDRQLDHTPEFLRPAVVDPCISTSQVRLAVPKIRHRIAFALDSKTDSVALAAQTRDLTGNQDLVGQSDPNSGPIFEVRNPAAYLPGRMLDRVPARITVTSGTQIVWQDFLLKSVLLATGNSNFWAAACEEGSIYVWTPAGRRLLNAIIVESQPVILENRGWWLLCVTSVGLCHVWNIKSLSSPHPPVSLAPILNIATLYLRNTPPHLQPGPGVTSALLNSEGHIIVTLTNGDGYMYSSSLQAWQRVSEAWFAVGSQYWNSVDSSVDKLPYFKVHGNDAGRKAEDDKSNVSIGIIPYLERRTTKEVLVRQRGFQLQKLVRSLFSREGFAGLESSVSIAHLENRIAAALHLGARLDFRMNLFMYAKRIGAEGLHGKVEELLKALLGDILRDVDEAEDGVSGRSSGHSGRGWDSCSEQLCGWDRRELLKGVVLILGKYRELQRITLPYARLLGITDDDDSEAMNT